MDFMTGYFIMGELSISFIVIIGCFGIFNLIECACLKEVQISVGKKKRWEK